MRKRLKVVLPAIAAAGVVAAAVTVGALSGEDPGPSSSGTAATEDDPRSLDVLVLVPDSAHAAKDRELITEAVGMWQQGIDSIADEPDLGWLRDARIRISAESLADGLDGTTYTLRDPEIVIVAATPPGGTSDATTAVDSLLVHAADDAVCETVADPFAYESWSGRPGFRSHHSLPEGTWIQDCGGEGGDVCFAINATIKPSATMDDVFATFGLVSDEFGHCLAGADGYTGP